MKRNFSQRLVSHLGGVCLCMSLFVLRLQNGQLRWYDGESSRWNEARCCVDALSAQERFRLNCGLTFATRADLTRALEDYCP